MARIQDNDWLYSFLRPWVDWLFRRSFRRFRYVGKENIPTDGAIIFSPNHVDALCDAMAILGIDHGPKVFVARADIFKKERTAKILTWLKIMPIRRVRDGLDEVRHNDETIDKAVDTLRSQVPFCILPEGTHHPKHTLLPLNKGIFRIALKAYHEFGNDKPVYIIPVGLEYGDYFHLWDTLMVNIGKPICINDYVSRLSEQYLTDNHEPITEPQIINALRDELTLRMRQQILWVPDDENYETNWQTLRDNPPAPFDAFKKRFAPKWLRLMLLILLAPLFVLSAAMTIPLWLTWILIQHKIKDPAFHNSVQYFVQVIFFTLTLCIPLPFWLFFEEYRYQLRYLSSTTRSATERR